MLYIENTGIKMTKNVLQILAQYSQDVNTRMLGEILLVNITYISQHTANKTNIGPILCYYWGRNYYSENSSIKVNFLTYMLNVYTGRTSQIKPNKYQIYTK